MDVKLFLYTFDFTGLVPQFRILKYNSYKSIVSTIISIIIIIFSISFSIYSIIEYIKFDNPSISYLKRYDNASNNTIFIKDTLFMFKAHGYCNERNINNLNIKYKATYDFIEGNQADLDVEECQIGKNINLKFKDELEKKYNDKINQFYCIKSESSNFPLFYNPGISSNLQSYVTIYLYNNEICLDNDFDIELITENDIIEHENIKNPIIASSYYYRTQKYTPNIFLRLDCEFEFIRYETDNGYFFPKSENSMAVGISEISHDIDERNNESYIGKIIFRLSRKNYSHYKRCYKKIQSLLADIMSIVNILIDIGIIISKILLKKK